MSANTPEPMPTKGKQAVLPELIQDLQARVEVGIKQYGMPLETNNGRDALMDCYQEMLDGAMYMKQFMMERGSTFLEFERAIRKWSNDRGLIEGTTVIKQYQKLLEEYEELGDALFDNKTALRDMLRNIKLEIGDMQVVLANICTQLGCTLEECAWLAYDKIKDRKGKMINGTFVKEEDLCRNPAQK